MRADIVPGAIFPDYELSDHTAKRRKLSELQEQHPMVLVLSRGGFCPKDRRQAEGLVALHREIEVGYCRLVTISTDNITETNEYRSGVGAHWPFLSDAGRIIQKDLDIAEYTDPTHNPMIPHTIVLEPGLLIYKIYMGYWFFGRPTVEELRQDLRAVIKKCRPDWDITTPEMKAAWQQGRKELFYPYDKTYVHPSVNGINRRPANENRKEQSQMTNGKVIVLIEAKIQPQRRAELCGAAFQYLPLVRAEPGVEAFYLAVRKDDANTFVFYEIYKSQAAQDFHLQQDFTKTFLAALKSAQAGDRVRTNLVELGAEAQ